MATTAKTLFIPMMDFPAETEHESNRWFDRDHVPDRLSCDGFLGCERFQLTTIEPPGWSPAELWTRYLNVYSVRAPEVLSSEAYRLNAEGTMNRWRQRQPERHRASGHVDFRSSARMFRSLWTQRPSPWALSPAMVQAPPRAIYVVLSDIAREHQDEVNAYLDTEAMVEWIACPGVVKIERYEAAEAGDTDSPTVNPTRYMDVYDLDVPEAVTSAAFRLQHATPSERGRALAQHINVRAHGVYLQRPSPWSVSLGE